MDSPDLLKWAMEQGVVAVVLVFVLLRLESQMKVLNQTTTEMYAFLRAWVESHAKSNAKVP